MSLLTPAEVQALGVGLDLTTASLQSVIDAEEAELNRRFGTATGPIIESIEGSGKSLYLKRAVSTVTTVVESLYLGDSAPTTLTALDYYIWAPQGRLQRLWTGTTPASHWGGLVTVTYVPVDDTSLRKTVLLDLIRINTEQSASGGGESVGGLSFSIGAKGGGTSASFDTQRSSAYARMGWLSR